MQKNNGAPRAPHLTVRDMGFFPPFFGWRVDYGGWFFARRFHLWMAFFVVGFVSLESIRIGLPWPYAFLSGLAYFLYNRVRRLVLSHHRELYFGFAFQFTRFVLAFCSVTALIWIAAMFSPSPNYFWILYYPVFAILSEYQPYGLRGLELTLLMIALGSSMLVIIPVATGQVPNDIRSLLATTPPVLAFAFIAIMFHYLIRNIQKRASEFQEERDYAVEIAELPKYADSIEEFAEAVLKIALKRVRAGYGTIWMCDPASGRVWPIVGLTRDTYTNECSKWSSGALPHEFYMEQSRAPSLVEMVALKGEAMYGTFCSPYAPGDLGARDQLPSRKPNDPFLVHHIAAAIRDPRQPQYVIGLIHIGYTAGCLETLNTALPMLGGLWSAARMYVLGWERRLLIHTAQQVSGAWALTRRDHTFGALLLSLRSILRRLEDPVLADLLAHHVSRAVGTPSLVWCRTSNPDNLVLNGIYPCPDDLRQQLQGHKWTWQSLGVEEESPSTSRTYTSACPSELLGLVPFKSPMLHIFPLLSNELIGAFGIIGRASYPMSPYEEGLLKTFADHLAYAIGSDRAVRARDEALEELNLLDDIAAEGLRPRPLEEFADSIRRKIKEKLGYDGVDIGVVRSNEWLEFPTWGEHVPGRIPLSSYAQPPASILEKWLRERQPTLWITDSPYTEETEHPLFANWAETKSAAAFPLAADDGECLGLLLVHSTDERLMTERDLVRLRPVAKQIALGLENMSLWNKVGSAAKIEERKRMQADMHDLTYQVAGELRYRAHSLFGRLRASAASGGGTERFSQDVDQLTELLTFLQTALEVVTTGEDFMKKTLRSFKQAVDDYLQIYQHLYVGRYQLTWDIDEECAYSLSEVEATNLFMIVSAAIGNAVNHSLGKYIRVALHTQVNGYVELVIEDDGVGFDVNQIEFSGSRHTGIRNIEKRADAIRWKWMLDSARGNGTRHVLTRLPQRVEPTQTGGHL